MTVHLRRQCWIWRLRDSTTPACTSRCNACAQRSRCSSPGTKTRPPFCWRRRRGSSRPTCRCGGRFCSTPCRPRSSPANTPSARTLEEVAQAVLGTARDPRSAAQRQRPAAGRFRHPHRRRLRRCGTATAGRGGDDVHRRGRCPRRHPVDDSGMVRRRRRVGRAGPSRDVRTRPSHRAPPGGPGGDADHPGRTLDEPGLGGTDERRREQLRRGRRDLGADRGAATGDDRGAVGSAGLAGPRKREPRGGVLDRGLGSAEGRLDSGDLRADGSDRPGTRAGPVPGGAPMGIADLPRRPAGLREPSAARGRRGRRAWRRPSRRRDGADAADRTRHRRGHPVGAGAVGEVDGH